MEIFITVLVLILAIWGTKVAVENVQKKDKTESEKFIHVLQIIVGVYNTIKNIINLKNLLSARFA